MDTLLNPTVIIEVLSDSTEYYDRGTKARHYHRLPSLQHYLLVSQDEAVVGHQSRQPDGSWLLREFRGFETAISLPALDLEIPLAAIYKGLELP